MSLSDSEARVQSSRVMNAALAVGLCFFAQWMARLGLSEKDTGKVVFGIIALLPAIPLALSLVRPVVNIVANSRGVTLGRGILFHTRQHIPWRDVVAIDQVEREQLAPRADTDQKIPIVKCVRITFADPVGLTSKGIYGARVENDSYIIEPKGFGFGVEAPRVIEVLARLRERHTKH